MRMYIVLEKEQNEGVSSAQTSYVKIHGYAMSYERAQEIAQAIWNPYTKIVVHEVNIDKNYDRLQLGDIVAHYKRKAYLLQKYGDKPHKYDPVYTYKIKEFAINTDTKEKMVIYEALYTDESLGVQKKQLFVRPYAEFMSKSDDPQCTQGYRYHLIIPDENPCEEY